MSSAAALKIIAKAAAEGRVAFSDHALDESMPDDGVFVPDVVHALAHGHTAREESAALKKWKVYGPLADGADYAVVVIITTLGVFVVTTHAPP